MFSLICVWINGWVNNREAGDLRRHRGHYDVIVMMSIQICLSAQVHMLRVDSKFACDAACDKRIVKF